jgi:hypothetical protein
MKIKNPRSFFNQLLLMICIIIPSFNNYELSFITWLFVGVLTIKNNYNQLFLKYVSIFVLLLILAYVIGLFFEYDKYFVIRDITYMLKPIFGLLIGYNLYTDKTTDHFKFLLYGGIAMALFHLVLVGYGVFYMGANNVRAIRFYGGYFNDYEIYALIFLLFKNQLNINISKKQYFSFLIILSVSSFFYLARTNFIQFGVLFLGMKGFLVLNKKSLTIVGASILFIVISYSAILTYNPVRNGKGLDEFLYKIKIIPTEAFSTRINRNDWRAFHDNYRSYENIRTIEQLTRNETFLFGEGLGGQVDLKQKVMLGDMMLRKISILHNGFMTVILKCGFVGLFIYLFTIFWFFRNTSHEKLIQINYIFVGTGVFLFISNWVFLGFYNQIDSKSLIVGYLFAMKNQILKK